MKKRKAGAAGGAPWHRRAGEQVNQGDRGEARGQEEVPPRPHRSQAAVLHRGGSAPQGTLGCHKWGRRTSPAASQRNCARQVTPLSPGPPSPPSANLGRQGSPSPGDRDGGRPGAQAGGALGQARCRPLQGAACYSVPAPSTAGSGPRNGERGEPNCTNGFVISRNGVFVHTSERLAGVEASSWGLPEARLACQLRGRGPPR